MTEHKMIEKNRLIESPDRALGRINSAPLTTTGVHFKSMNYHDPDVTLALLDEPRKDAAVRSQYEKPYLPERAQVVIKWNPADAGAILVWKRGAQPSPHFVPIRSGPEFGGVSFWHCEKLCEFAKRLDLEFKSEAHRRQARDRLRKRIVELVTDQSPTSNGLRERRNLGQTDSLRLASRVLPSKRPTD